jgi:hypothetical protein
MACGGFRAHVRPSRLRRSPSLGSVESLTARISELVVERQELRLGDASVAEIERNRVELAQAQWDLAHALIDRFLPSPKQSAA